MYISLLNYILMVVIRTDDIMSVIKDRRFLKFSFSLGVASPKWWKNGESVSYL